jgi:hypothetical protein
MSLDASRRADRAAILVSSLVLVLAVAVAVRRQTAPEWRRAQDAALGEIAAEVSPAVADRIERGLRQVWIPEVARTDRCVTCHVGIEGGPDLARLSPLARSHPRPDLLRQHPVERFGCTLCHGGSGLAVTAEEAHGEAVASETPMLSAARARRHGLAPADLLEVNCATCHRAFGAKEAMPRVEQARALVDKFRCRRCHIIDGRGGAVGPDLSRAGERPPANVVFPADWTGERTLFAWNVGHFLSPTRFTPKTEMPDFALSEDAARSLAILVASWRRQALPPAWTPGSPVPGRR